MASAIPTLVDNGLLMYVNSNISRDTNRDIINVIHDAYNDEAVVLAKNLLWDHYAEIASLGKNTSRRSKYKHVEDIIDAIVKIDATFSDKEELPVVFVASDMRALPAMKMKDLGSSSERVMENRVKALEEQMITMMQINNNRMSYRQAAISQQKPRYTTQEIRSMERPGSTQISSNGSKILQQVEGNMKDDQLTTESGTILDESRLNTLRSTMNRTNSPEIKGDWQQVGKQQPRPRPRPIYGKKKTDGELTALPRRYTIVVFNVSDKNNDNVKNYMKTNNVNILEITRLSGDDRFVHSFKVVIYRKDLDTVLNNEFWPEDVGCRSYVYKKKIYNLNGDSNKRPNNE